MRPFPSHYEEYLTLALAERLSYPVGRALYACNRQQSGGMKHWDYHTGYSAAETMRRCKVSTAKRWIRHWGRGGSIRCISLSQAQWNEKCRAYAKRVRDRRR